MSPAIPPTHPLTAALLAGLALAPLCPAQPSPEEPSTRVLVDTSLNHRPVTLQAINADSVQLRDLEGRLFTQSRADVLALLPALSDLDTGAVAPPPSRPQAAAPIGQAVGRLELTDGQVLPGSLSIPGVSSSESAPTGAPADGDRLSWQSKLWGLIEVPFENIRSISFQPDTPEGEYFDPGAAEGASEDVVLALNGDRLQGFVSSVSGVVRIEQDGVASDLPLDRVATIVFANPPQAPQGGWIWLHEGATAAVSTIMASDPEHITVTAAIEGIGTQPTATLTWADVRAISFDTRVLRPLASLPYVLADDAQARTTSGGSGWLSRRWTPPPVVGVARSAPLAAPDIELPGPMSVEWQLPPGSTRVATQAELPLDCRVWGDCEVVFDLVSGSGALTNLSRHHLTSAAPSVSAVVQLPTLAPGARLRISVEAGPSGPIQDRVTLRRPLILVDP